MSDQSISHNSDSQSHQKVPCIQYDGLKLPVAEINKEALRQLDPNRTNPYGVMSALLDQIGNQNNILWLGMYNLAKDIKSIQKKEDREQVASAFESFADSIGLVLTDVEGNKLNIAEELKKI